MSKAVAFGDTVNYNFPGLLRTLGFPGEVAFGDCVYSRYSGRLDPELFKFKEKTLVSKPWGLTPSIARALGCLSPVISGTP